MSGNAPEPGCPVAGQRKSDAWESVDVTRGIGAAQVAPRHGGDSVDDVPFGAGGSCRAGGGPQKIGVRRQDTSPRRQGGIARGKRPVGDQFQLQHRRPLDDLLDAFGLIHSRKLDQDFIVPLAVFLNGGFGHSQGVHTAADGADRLLQGIQANRPGSGDAHTHPPGSDPILHGRAAQVPLQKLVPDHVA